MALYEHYGPLVPVGSYLVFEDTILNGASRLDRVRSGTLGGGEADRGLRASSSATRRWNGTRSPSTPGAS